MLDDKLSMLLTDVVVHPGKLFVFQNDVVSPRYTRCSRASPSASTN